MLGGLFIFIAFCSCSVHSKMMMSLEIGSLPPWQTRYFDCDDGDNFIAQMIVHPAHNRWDQVGDEVPTPPTLRTCSQHRLAQDSDDAQLNRPVCSAIFRINTAHAVIACIFHFVDYVFSPFPGFLDFPGLAPASFLSSQLCLIRAFSLNSPHPMRLASFRGLARPGVSFSLPATDCPVVPHLPAWYLT